MASWLNRVLLFLAVVGGFLLLGKSRALKDAQWRLKIESEKHAAAKQRAKVEALKAKARRQGLKAAEAKRDYLKAVKEWRKK